MSRHRKLKKARVPLVIAALAIAGVLAAFAAAGVLTQEGNAALIESLTNEAAASYQAADVIPAEGFETGIVLGDVVPRLVESGAIDLEKFKQIYASRGGLTEEQLSLLTEPGTEPLKLTPENAGFLLNILWPLGIANKNPVLDEMESYSGVARLASTGGWTLGKEDAMAYFNKLELMQLSGEEQANLEEVAGNAYRPCCNNPTAFPDCNHGAALLALLELGASQGMGREELYTLALQANALWFPQQYLSTATLYISQGRDYWANAKEIMGLQYSSATGWANNVYKPLQEKGMLPKAGGGGGCGV